MKKLILSVSIALILTLIIIGITSREPEEIKLDLPKPSEEFYVYDETNTLSQETKNYILSINNQINGIEGIGLIDNSQVVVAIVKSLNKKPIEEYSTALFRKWGIGDKEKNNGILLLIAKDDGEARIEVGYGFEGVITDGIAGFILDNDIIPELKNNDFNKGVTQGFTKIVDIITSSEGVVVGNLETEIDDMDEENWTEVSGIKAFLMIGVMIILTIFFGSIVLLITSAPIIIIIIIIRKSATGKELNKWEKKFLSIMAILSIISGSKRSSQGRSRSGGSGSRGGGGRSGGGGASRRF